MYMLCGIFTRTDRILDNIHTCMYMTTTMETAPVFKLIANDSRIDRMMMWFEMGIVEFIEEKFGRDYRFIKCEVCGGNIEKYHRQYIPCTCTNCPSCELHLPKIHTVDGLCIYCTDYLIELISA
jgi:hypothetical protein